MNEWFSMGSAGSLGSVVSVRGSVVDVRFEGPLPAVFTLLRVHPELLVRQPTAGTSRRVEAHK